MSAKLAELELLRQSLRHRPYSPAEVAPALLALPSVGEVVMMSPAQVEAYTRGLDSSRRFAEASTAAWINIVDRAGAYAADGHRSVKAWGQATCNWSGAEAARLVKTGRMLARFESAAAAAAEGKLGVAQMHALSQVVANPRVAKYLEACEQALVAPALTLDFDDYIKLLAQWEAIADEDGAHGSHERAHQERNAHLSIVGERVYLDASGGAAQGVGLLEIFEQFCRSEWLADWDEGVATHGELMSPALMKRTDRQRRFDALQSIFEAAAVSGRSPVGEPVVNLVVGQELFEHHLRRALGQNPPPLDPANPAHRCETVDGVVIDPHDAIIAAAIGHVRRVVLDSSGVVVDAGRKQRLFTGALRDLVLLSGRRCMWPGCHRPGSRCQADHTQPYASTGTTATRNGGPACGHHNRWKSRGYRTQRDANGQWHHYRPDGTEIGWRAAA